MDEISEETLESINISRNSYLKSQININDQELNYLNQILKLQYKPRQIRFNGNNPSVIIEDFLYQGHINHAINVNLLNTLNIKHILNLSNIHLSKAITEQFNVLSINVIDDIHTNINEYFEITNEYLNSCKQKNEKVLINCHKGISRSSAFILAYLIK